MTAQEFLSLPIELNKRIEARRMQIEELRAAAERSTSSLDFMLHSQRDPHARESLMAALADQTTALSYDYLDFLDAHEAIRDALDQIPLEYSQITQVASLRYLSRLTWKRIEEITGLSQSQLLRCSHKIVSMIEVPEKYKKS